MNNVFAEKLLRFDCTYKVAGYTEYSSESDVLSVFFSGPNRRKKPAIFSRKARPYFLIPLLGLS